MRKIVIAVLFTMCGVAWGQVRLMTGPGEITTGVKAIATDVIDLDDKDEMNRLLYKAISFNPYKIEGISIPEYTGRVTPHSIWVHITDLNGNWTLRYEGEDDRFKTGMLYEDSIPFAMLIRAPNRIEGTYCVLWTKFLNYYLPVLILCDPRFEWAN